MLAQKVRRPVRVRAAEARVHAPPRKVYRARGGDGGVRVHRAEDGEELGGDGGGGEGFDLAGEGALRGDE